MLVARGEYCLMMDADGATKFTDLEKLEEALEKAMVPSELNAMWRCAGIFGNSVWYISLSRIHTA